MRLRLVPLAKILATSYEGWPVGKLIAVLLVVALAAGLWFAGEQHRQNCIDDNKTSCSVLPWDDGEAKAGAKGTTGKDGATKKKRTNPNKIPSNQSFSTYRNRKEGYSIRYPEGWTRRDSKSAVVFKKEANFIRIAVAKGKLPTPSKVKTQLKKFARKAKVEIEAETPKTIKFSGKRAVRVSFTQKLKKRKVEVKRYVLSRKGKRAIVDLGTPEGIDNESAYRKVIRSFNWL